VLGRAERGRFQRGFEYLPRALAMSKRAFSGCARSARYQFNWSVGESGRMDHAAGSTTKSCSGRCTPLLRRRRPGDVYAGRL